MRAVHRVGLRSTATMMFGIGDTVVHRVRHLQRVRDLQDGRLYRLHFPGPFKRENTALGRRIKEEPTGSRLPEDAFCLTAFSTTSKTSNRPG